MSSSKVKVCVCVVSIEYLALRFPFSRPTYLVSGIFSMVATTCTHTNTHYVHRRLKSPILAYNNPSLSFLTSVIGEWKIPSIQHTVMDIDEEEHDLCSIISSFSISRFLLSLKYKRVLNSERK